jgi:TPP-dependent 2-oxoacid decarboxylase
VHISEFEPKQPQIQRRYNTADAIALQNTRPQRFQQPQTMKSLNPTFAPNDNTIVDSGGATVTVVNVSLPGTFDFEVDRNLFTGNGITTTVASMVPQNPSAENRERQLNISLGSVTITI